MQRRSHRLPTEPAGRDLTRQDWFIGALFAVATALLGAGLGVGADLAADLWGGPIDVDNSALLVTRETTLVGLVLLGVAALCWGVYLWRRERRRLQRRGTLYIVREIARDWTPEEHRKVLTPARRHFANMLYVPGPTELGRPCHWSSAEASVWGARVDDLVRSFWAVHHNDESSTKNCVAIWAEWSVAWSFAQRAIAADRRRGLDLEVLRRESSGRSGRFRADPGADALVFDIRAERGDPGKVIRHEAELTVCRVPGPTDPGVRGRPGVILLVNLTGNSWGRAKLGPDSEGSLVELVVEDAAETDLRVGEQRAEVLEWQYVSPTGGHPVTDFPWVAQASLEWLIAAAKRYPGHVLLVGLLAPQEVSLGLGILAAQFGTDLPAQLWPLVRIIKTDAGTGAEADFVIPRLNLGGTR